MKKHSSVTNSSSSAKENGRRHLVKLTFSSEEIRQVRVAAALNDDRVGEFARCVVLENARQVTAQHHMSDNCGVARQEQQET
jgi:hypothetical protein